MRIVHRTAVVIVGILGVGGCEAGADGADGRGSVAVAARSDSQVAGAPSCGTAPGHDLAVLVGRKLDVQRIQPDVPAGAILLDGVFRARYHVLQVLCGAAPTPQVEFVASDHYGRPAFAEHETVLLFLGRQEGAWYQEKYQYYDVYETANGSWASCGDPYRFDHAMHRGAVTARPIAFKQEVSFSLASLTEEQIRERYPPPDFERQGDRAVCRRGVLVADLFAVKREGVLKSRGLFR